MRATLYSAQWVVPVSTGPIRHGAVLVDEGGTIAAVAPAADVQVGDDVARVELGDAILLPGLINVHAHPELSALRGLLEDLPFHAWVPALRRIKDLFDVGDYGAAARWSCLEAAAAGVTTIGATEESGASLDALRESGLRGIVYHEVVGAAPEQAAGAFARLRARVERARKLESARVRIGISPHAPYTVSDTLYRQCAAYATTERLPIAVHVAESEAEAQLVEAGAGPFAGGLRTRGIATPPRAATSIALLERVGILAARPLLIHCVRVNGDDIRRIADAGAAVAHCPVANARLGHGTAPIVELLEAGVTVGIGSDSVAANNRVDLIEEARIAQLLQRARLRSAGALPATRLLRMLTIDAARALGIDAHVGSLVAGKQADLCAVRLGRPHTRPVGDPVTTLLLSAHGGDVVLTVVGGAVLYHDGRFGTLDADRLRAHIDALGTRLLESNPRAPLA